MPDLRLGFFQKGVEVGFDEPLECGFSSQPCLSAMILAT